MSNKEFNEILDKIPQDVVDEFKNDDDFSFVKLFLEKNEAPHSKKVEYIKDVEKLIETEKKWTKKYPNYGFIPICTKALIEK